MRYEGVELLIGNYETAERAEPPGDSGDRDDLPTFDLRPYEARVYSLESP